MRRAALPSGCARCGDGAGCSAIKIYQLNPRAGRALGQPPGFRILTIPGTHDTLLLAQFQRLQCQANVSNVCRVLKVSQARLAAQPCQKVCFNASTRRPSFALATHRSEQSLILGGSNAGEIHSLVPVKTVFLLKQMVYFEKRYQHPSAKPETNIDPADDGIQASGGLSERPTFLRILKYT